MSNIDNLTVDSQVHVEIKRSSHDGFESKWAHGTVVEVKKPDKVVVQIDNERVEVKVEQLFLRNPEHLQAVDDITTLSYLHEPALLDNLKARYNKNLIYTYTGSILIAINPYKALSEEMYGKETIEIYRGVPMGKLSPHVYAMAEDCFSNMMREGKNQSILVSGESGAGKTETTKFLLQYFAAMSTPAKPQDQRKSLDRKSLERRRSLELKNSSKNSIENQVLLSTPLLEAFGNAKTLRNDNSSRFGKFIEIQFNEFGAIVGAEIHTYLLEKSRVTKQTKGERNFHIFYQLLAGCNDDEKNELFDGKIANDFFYISTSGCIEVEGTSDKSIYEKTLQALTTIGISTQEQNQIKKTIAAILHLGNIRFQKLENDRAKIIDDAPLVHACKLLDLNFETIAASFLTKKVVAGRETMTTHLKVDQAESSRDTLAMLLYSKLFDWIVQRINDNINNASLAKQTVGILDIYGFESFDVNSFEQFCINYANEKLQQQFYQHIFKLSQEEYLKEKINWSNITFNDNQICLDLIENSKLCILKILDEECNFPRSDERTLAEKLFKHHQEHPSFSRPKTSQTAFTVNHYVDSVTYDTTHFLSKNKDYTVPEQFEAIRNSPNAFLNEMIQGHSDTSTSKSSFKFTSVASQFKESLSLLMEKIKPTFPHYIRCVKPNLQKKANSFNFDLVLHQLKCGGILEAIRICLEGYPTKKLFNDFFDRYKIMYPKSSEMEIKQASSKLLQIMGIPDDKYQLGLTKVFLRSGQIEKIEMARTLKLHNYATEIQKNVKRMITMKWWGSVRSSCLNLERAIRTKLAEDRYEDLRTDNASRVIGQLVRKSIESEQKDHVFNARDIIAATSRQKFAGDELREKQKVLKLSLVVASLYRQQLKKIDYQLRLAEAQRVKLLEKRAVELEVRVTVLDEQVKKGISDRERLSAHVTDLELEKMGLVQEIENVSTTWQDKYHTLNVQYSEMQQQLENHKSIEYSLGLELRGTRSQLSRNENTWRGKYDDLEKHYNQLVQQIEDFKHQTGDLQNSYAISEQSLMHAKNMCNQLSTGVDHLVKSMSFELDSMKQQNMVLESRLRSANTMVLGQESDTESLANKIAQLELQLQYKDDELQNLSTRLKEKEHEIVSDSFLLQKHFEEDLNRRLEDKLQEIDQLRHELAHRPLTDSDTELKELDSQLEMKNKMLQEQVSLTEHLQSSCQSLKATNTALLLKLEKMQFQFIDLENSIEIETQKRLEAEKERLGISAHAPDKWQQHYADLEYENMNLQKQLIELQKENGELNQRLSNAMSENSLLRVSTEKMNIEWNEQQKILKSQHDQMAVAIDGLTSKNRELASDLDLTRTQWNEAENVWRAKYMDLEARSQQLQQALETQLIPQHNIISVQTVEPDQRSESITIEKLEHYKQKLKKEREKRRSVVMKYKDMQNQYELNQSEIIGLTASLESKMKHQIAAVEQECAEYRQKYDSLLDKLEHEAANQLNIEQQNHQMSLIIAKLQDELENERSSRASKVSSEESVALQELIKERSKRLSLETQIKTMEQEKVRVMQRKEAETTWEINKHISLFPGSGQEKAERFVVFLLFEIDQDICGNILPTPAFLIYHLIKSWLNDKEGCERLLQLVENLLKAVIGSGEEKSLCYWFANVAALLQLFTTEEFLGSIQELKELASSDTAYEPKNLRNHVLDQLKSKESYKTFNQELDSALSLSSVHPSSENMYTRFIHSLAKIFMNSYTQLVYNCYDDLSDLIKAHIIDQILDVDNNGEDSNPSASCESIGATIKTFLQALRMNKISENIVSKAIHQIYSFIDVTLFDEILFRKDICSSSRAIQLRSQITQLENDIYHWTGIKGHLKLVMQVISLLLTDKQMIMNEQVRAKLMPNLNSLQILKLLRMYNTSEFESPIPLDVYNYFTQDQPAIVPIYSEHAIILDTNEINPFTSFHEITNEVLRSELPFISFPIPVKERLNRMIEEENRKKEREQVAKLVEEMKSESKHEKSSSSRHSFWGRKSSRKKES